MTDPVICTLFDKNYLVKGLLMLESFFRHHPTGRAYVLPGDEETGGRIYEWGTKAGHILGSSLMILDALPDMDVFGCYAEEFSDAVVGRTQAEKYFSMTPFLMSYVLYREEELGHSDGVIYVDADCFFLQPMGSDVLDRMSSTDILITPHRWSPEHAARLRPNGTFNVGWLYLSGKGNSRPALMHWMIDCLYPPRKEPSGRFSDQLLLEDWPEKYGQSVIMNHPGINLAPWNQKQYLYMTRASGLALVWPVTAGEVPVILYHFHEFHCEFKDHQATVYRTGYRLDSAVVDHIYIPYEQLYLEKCLELQKGTV